MVVSDIVDSYNLDFNSAQYSQFAIRDSTLITYDMKSCVIKPQTITQVFHYTRLMC